MTSIAALSVRSVRDEIGPRRPGAIYATEGGRYEVLALVTDPKKAAGLLGRAAARWAVIVRDTLHPQGEPYAIGTAWTITDYLIRPGKPAFAQAA
ncbi:hypothetical protein [Streptomyces sp. BRA346]|uniref:hypothetical protein n=1 Tax=Streptomyces sp. BRA346 TaxID=2878199 RepID=UPI00406462E2